MMFTLDRDLTVVSRMGHSIAFVANQPTHVPDECSSEVIAVGARPSDADAAAQQGTDAALAPPPAEMDSRASSIEAAIREMMLRNTDGDFTAQGVPNAKVLSGLVGWKVELEERDAIWAKLNGGAA